MIFDNLNNCEKYFGLNKSFEKAFEFLKNVTADTEDKKYELDGKVISDVTKEVQSEQKLSENVNTVGDVICIKNGRELTDEDFEKAL